MWLFFGDGVFLLRVASVASRREGSCGMVMEGLLRRDLIFGEVE